MMNLVDSQDYGMGNLLAALGMVNASLSIGEMMAKQRKKISVETAKDYQGYIEGEINKDTLSDFLIDAGKEPLARKTFDKLVSEYLELDNCPEEGLEEFNHWCDLYISDSGWRKFTNRQANKRHSLGKGLIAAKLEKDVYQDLLTLSSKHSRNINNSLRALLKLEKNNKSEFKEIISAYTKK